MSNLRCVGISLFKVAPADYFLYSHEGNNQSHHHPLCCPTVEYCRRRNWGPSWWVPMAIEGFLCGVGQNIALHASSADRTCTHLGCQISAFPVHSDFILSHTSPSIKRELWAHRWIGAFYVCLLHPDTIFAVDWVLKKIKDLFIYPIVWFDSHNVHFLSQSQREIYFISDHFLDRGCPDMIMTFAVDWA